jgi:hypothetical protein
MFRVLKKIIARLLGFGRQRPPSSPPHDPYAGVPEPRRHRPSGGQTAVAMMEPDPPGSVDADARGRS